MHKNPANRRDFYGILLLTLLMGSVPLGGTRDGPLYFLPSLWIVCLRHFEQNFESSILRSTSFLFLRVW